MVSKKKMKAAFHDKGQSEFNQGLVSTADMVTVMTEIPVIRIT